MKQAILVTSFGTSHLETLEKNISALEKDIAENFSGFDIKRAFTSEIIRAKLKKRDNLDIDNVDSALSRLAQESYQKVIIQPTLIVSGLEYEKKILAPAGDYVNKFDFLKIGAPLMSATEDYIKLSAALGRAYKGANAFVFIGHGTTHHSDSAYAALDYHFKAAGFSNFFVATVGGYPDIDTVCEAVKKFGSKKVTMLPLMLVAGDHSIKDIAGEDETSWKSVFEKKGFDVTCILKGLGELPEIRKIYLEHIRGADR